MAKGEVSAQPSTFRWTKPFSGGFKTNLGIILSGTQTASARGQRLSELQSLLPSVEPAARKPYRSRPARRGVAYQGLSHRSGAVLAISDVRLLSWSLVDLNSLHNYLAARHNFAPPTSPQDARELVVLTVGNAYLLALADETR